MCYDPDKTIICRGCGKTDRLELPSDRRHHPWQRIDFHGISTGEWCDKCYENGNYPYRKDDYTHGTGIADDGTPIEPDH